MTALALISHIKNTNSLPDLSTDLHPKQLQYCLIRQAQIGEMKYAVSKTPNYTAVCSLDDFKIFFSVCKIQPKFFMDL